MSEQDDNNTDDTWKEIAAHMKSQPSKAGPVVQQLIARMNQVLPFREAQGLLDNGCGSGSIVSHVLETYGAEIPSSSRIFAADFSKSMLDVVRSKKQTRIEAGEDVWRRLEVCKLDAHDMKDLKDDSMSHITGGHLYFLLEDSRQALRETHRVLRPGGVLGLTSGKSAQHLDAIQDAVENVRPGTNLKMLKEAWSSEAGVRDEMASCGFVDVETYPVQTTMSYGNVDEFSSTMLLMPVMKDVIATFSDAEKQRLHSELVKNIKSVDSEQSGSLSGVNIIGIGRKPS